MDILYVSDEGYSPILGASLLSLLKNNESVKQLTIYIVSDGIREQSREKLVRIAIKYHRKVAFLDKPDMKAILGEIPNLYRWSDNIFCRLYIPTCFKANGIEMPERILYLDCDTIICRELTALWNTNVEDKICAAGLECMGNVHKKLIGLKPEDSYYNSGVILIDLRKWVELQIEKKCTIFLKENMDYLEYPDEGVLNGTLRGKILTLPPEYNFTTLKCTFTFDELKKYRKSKVMYKRKEYLNALANPVIIHYTSNFLVRRPWLTGEGNTHYFEDDFRTYYKEGDWQNDENKDEVVSKAKKFARVITEKKRALGISLFGFVYSYVKPIKLTSMKFIRFNHHLL